MKKLLLSLIITCAIITISRACSCSVFENTAFQYQQANFVATVKILKNYKNSPDSNDYYKADIEILELYKGKKTKSIYILGSSIGNFNNSCGTFIKEGETRLIFGSSSNTNTISTYLCTSYYQPDEISYKSSNTRNKLLLLRKYSKRNVIQFKSHMAIYLHDFKQIYKAKSGNYYSLIKIVITKKGVLKEIKSLTNDDQTLKETYQYYFRNIINWQSRLSKISNTNSSKDITLIIEINPYTSLKPLV